MANQPLTTLVELVTVTDSSSIIHVVDLAEAAAVDQNKKITIANLAAAVSALSTLSDPYYASNFTIGNAAANGTNSLAMGLGIATGNESIAIGNTGTVATGIGSIAVGDNTDVTATGLANVGIGTNVEITGSSGFSVAIGNTATIDGASATVVIGNNSGSDSSSAIAIGSNTTTDDSSPNAIGLGTGATITQAARSIVIGNSALVDGTGGFTEQIVIGDMANASLGARIICIGESATGSATEGIAIGAQTDVQNLRGVALGTLAVSAGDNAIQLGAGTNSTNGTLQFRTFPICNETSLFTAFTSPVNYTPGVNTQIDDHLSAIDTALGLASGDPYFVSNSAGTLPTASGTDAIAIGENTTASQTDSIAIGVTTTATGLRSISIGSNPDATAENGIAIGTDITNSGFGGIAIGHDSGVSVGGNLGIAIGDNADCQGANSIALGVNSLVTVSNSMQIGAGTNSSAQTLQFFTNTLANAQGLFTSFTTPTNYTPGDTDNITSHLQAIDTALGTAGGEAYFTTDNMTGATPVSSGVNSIAIGRIVTANDTAAIVIGQSSTASAVNTVAIGNTAVASAAQAVQIGFGTNNTADTLQYKANRLANDQGLYTSFTGPTNYTPADTDNVTSHFQAIDTALGAISGGTGFTSNVETLGATKTLVSADQTVQALNPNGTARDVVLPDPPTNNDHFVIVNNSDGLSASGNTLNIKETAAGGVVQVLDDTTGLLSINAIYNGASSTWVLWS